jgi:hypothetical protein
MKKLLVVIMCLFVCSSQGFSQSSFTPVVTDHYRVNTESGEEYSSMIASKMESALLFFNELMHFDLSKLPVKFKVTIYKEKASFDAYLSNVLGLTRDDFVYIHYSDLAKCELVGFVKEDESDMNISLLHQGFIQLIKAFYSNVPIWMSDGIAAYLENATYTKPVPANESESAKPGAFILNINLAMLDAFKSVIKGDGGQKIIPLEDFLVLDRADAVNQINIFYPEAWGFIYFLLTSPDKNNARILWDSLCGMDPSLSVKDNSVLIRNKIYLWIGKETLEKNFIDYIVSSKTFNDLLTEGLTAYNNNDLKKANEDFSRAGELKPGHYFPQYYLGLIAYDTKQYDAAEAYYKKAQELGMEKGLINYALGVNEYANNQYEQSIVHLQEAAKEDPTKFGEKADTLLKQIDEEMKQLGTFESATPVPTVEPTVEPTTQPTPAPTSATKSTPKPTPEPTPEPAADEEAPVEEAP